MYCQRCDILPGNKATKHTERLSSLLGGIASSTGQVCGGTGNVAAVSFLLALGQCYEAQTTYNDDEMRGRSKEGDSIQRNNARFMFTTSYSAERGVYHCARIYIVLGGSDILQSSPSPFTTCCCYFCRHPRFCKTHKIMILSQPPCRSAPRPTCSVIEQSRYRRWCHKSHYYSPGISTRASATIENRLTPSESVPGTMTLQWCAPRAGN